MWKTKRSCIDADSVLSSIDTEIRQLNYQEKLGEQQKVDKLRNALTLLKDEFQAGKTDKPKPVVGLGREDRRRLDEQRQRLLSSNQAVDESSASVENTLRMLDETTETVRSR